MSVKVSKVRKKFYTRPINPILNILYQKIPFIKKILKKIGFISFELRDEIDNNFIINTKGYEEIHKYEVKLLFKKAIQIENLNNSKIIHYGKKKITRR